MDFQFPSFRLTFPIFILLVFIVVKLLKIKTYKNISSASKLPPGPSVLPLIGNLHQLFGSNLIHQTLRDLATKHGSLMFLKLGQIPTLVVSSPESAKEVLKTHDVIFASRPMNLFTKIALYDSKDFIFSPYGEYWRQLRKILVQEVLSPTRVQSFRPIREKVMSNLVEWIGSHEGSSINLTKKIFSSTFDIISLAAFGKEIKDNDKFIMAMREFMKLGAGFDVFELFPSIHFLQFLSPYKARLERNHRHLDTILEKIIDEHRDHERKSEEDLTDVLFKFHNKGELGFSLSIESIKAVILDVFIAAVDSSATTLDWAMAELSKNPQVMRKAQEEVRQVFSRKGCVDEKGLDEMTYLKCVVKETLRLHPPGPLIPRECREKCKVNGFEVAAKTKVIVNCWAIARDGRYWSEPESFIPERFLNSSIDFKGHDFEFIPFGSGRRICPGLSYSVINTELSLAIMLYHFDWKLSNGKQPKDLDMTESFGLSVRRREDLNLIPSVVNN